MVAKKGKKRLTRHNKKGNLKNRLTNTDDLLYEGRVINKQSEYYDNLRDEDLFTIDKSPQMDERKLTRRQQAFLNKKDSLKRIAEQNEIHDEKPQVELRTFPKKNFIKAAPRPAEKNEKEARVHSSTHDLWAGDDGKPQNEIEKWYLKATKKSLPKLPKTMNCVPSFLPHVKVVEAGASYNPLASCYAAYVNKIAEKELAFEKKSKRLEETLKISPEETFATPRDIEAEETAGLFDEPEDEEDDEKECTKFSKAIVCNRKTRQQRREEEFRKKMQMIKKKRKLKNKEMQLIYSVKRLNKEITKNLDEEKKLAAKRKKEKLFKHRFGTHKLGRGEFVPEEDPFLAREELCGSLREIRPQGSIISERLNSLKQRNILPTPGERSKTKVKRRLKIKKVEKRSYKEVTATSKHV